MVIDKTYYIFKDRRKGVFSPVVDFWGNVVCVLFLIFNCWICVMLNSPYLFVWSYAALAFSIYATMVCSEPYKDEKLIRLVQKRRDEVSYKADNINFILE